MMVRKLASTLKNGFSKIILESTKDKEVLLKQIVLDVNGIYSKDYVVFIDENNKMIILEEDDIRDCYIAKFSKALYIRY